jgi:hypothetical protein
MWMLFDELERYNAEGAIRDGAQTIDGFRIFSDDDSVSRDYVYIGRCGDFFGSDSGSVILAYGHDYILVKNVNLIDIFNCVIGVFDKYRTWGERINAALHHAEPFQAVIDVAHEIIGSPMFFGQKNMRILAITRQYTSEQVFEEWDDMKHYAVIPLRLIKRLAPYDLPAKYPDEFDPAVIPAIEGSAEARAYRYAIRTACYLNGKIWGHLFIFYKNDRVANSLLQLLRYIVKIFEKLLHIKHKNDMEYNHFLQLANLLDGATITNDDISKLYYMFNWNETTSLVVYKIIPSTQAFDKMLFDSVCSNLAERFPNAVVFPHADTIVLVASQFQVEEQTLKSTINQFISLGSFQCGRSLPFCGIENLATYYEQAQYAIVKDADGHHGIHFFEDNAYTCLAKAFNTHLGWRRWVLPSLIGLMDMDASQGTEYFKTLYCLLQNKSHYGNTAKALFIHRNTLTYRLSRIESLLGVDLQNEHTVAYLRFCYEMMKLDGIEIPGAAACE